MASSSTSVFHAIAPFSFQLPAGNLLRKNKSVQSCITCRRRKTKCDRQWPCTPCKNRGEADTCEPYVREPNNRPTGYTHVSDTSILANRVAQLETALSRLIARVDDVGMYADIVNDFKDPLPVFRPNRDGDDEPMGSEKQEPGDMDDSMTGTRDMDLRTGRGGGGGVGDGDGRGSEAAHHPPPHHQHQQQPSVRPRAPSTPQTASAAGTSHVGPSPHVGHGVAGGDLGHSGHGHSQGGHGGHHTHSQHGHHVGPPSGPPPPPPPQAAHAHQQQQQHPDLVSPAHILASIAQCPPTFDVSNPGHAAPHANIPIDMGYAAAAAAAAAQQTWQPQHGGGGGGGVPPSFPMEGGGYGATTSSGHGISEPTSKAPSMQEHNATLELEAMALGRGAVWDERSPEKEHERNDHNLPTLSSLIPVRPRAPELAGILKEFPQVASLPNVLQGRYVLQYYLDSIDHNWRAFHRPTFEAQCSDLFGRIRARVTEFTLGELATLALYSVCISVGLLFLHDDALHDLGLAIDEVQALATTCWKIGYAALDESEWMQHHDIRGIQTVIVGGLYLSARKRANQHWAMLGSATKVAMAMGLAEIPDESKVAAMGTQHVLPRWRSAVDREVGRRVWFNLLEYDVLFTMENNFMYIINPELSLTAEPSNINDADIHPDVPVVSLPNDTYTDMSHNLARGRMMVVLRSLTAKVRRAGRIRYQFVTEAHQDLLQCIERRPLFFRDTDTIVASDAVQLHKIKREASLLSEATDLRMVRLHRYFFPESCHNPRYLNTKQACLAAARRMLSPEARHRMSSSNHPHFWAQNYMVFTATMIVIIYLIYATPGELDEIKALAEDGISQLKRMTTRNRLDLNDTADTLRVLMENQLARRDAESPSKSLKRNFGDFLYESWGNGAGIMPEMMGDHHHKGGAPGAMFGGSGDPGSVVDPGSASGYTDTDLGFVFDTLLNDYALNVN